MTRCYSVSKHGTSATRQYSGDMRKWKQHDTINRSQSASLTVHGWRAGRRGGAKLPLRPTRALSPTAQATVGNRSAPRGFYFLSCHCSSLCHARVRLSPTLSATAKGGLIYLIGPGKYFYERTTCAGKRAFDNMKTNSSVHIVSLQLAPFSEATTNTHP